MNASFGKGSVRPGDIAGLGYRQPREVSMTSTSAVSARVWLWILPAIAFGFLFAIVSPLTVPLLLNVFGGLALASWRRPLARRRNIVIFAGLTIVAIVYFSLVLIHH